MITSVVDKLNGINNKSQGSQRLIERIKTKEQEMQDMLFETVELETPSNTDTSVTDVIASDVPIMTDPEWNDYVMSMFTDKEMYNGNFQ